MIYLLNILKKNRHHLLFISSLIWMLMILSSCAGNPVQEKTENASSQIQTTKETVSQNLNTKEDSAPMAQYQKNAINPELRTIFIVGDSTAQLNNNPNAIGWGMPFIDFFDPRKINVFNAAIGGRSSRTYITEGFWGRLLNHIQPGDYVLIQFGHNDGGPINHKLIPRGSLPGLGDETREIDNLKTGEHEIIHSYGWYMRKMIREAKEKKAIPILLSLTVRNVWRDGKVERGAGHYGEWTRELATSEGIAFIDLTRLVADDYEKMGPDAVKPFFPRDPTHTSAAGADFNARHVVSGIKALHENGILNGLSTEGRTIDTGPSDSVMIGHQPYDRNAPREAFFKWLNLPEPADPDLPTVFLIGDSTVRTGRGDGANGQWGWGDALSVYFDPMKVNLVNRSVGGMGARSFITVGFWDKVLAMIKPGDFVIMQFGHNDNGKYGALPGIGDNSREGENSKGAPETVYSFGAYLRRYVAEAREKGATPIICTLIPRNIWKDGKIIRLPNGHARWARETAKAEHVPLLDLYENIARQYDKLDKETVTAFFADKYVHTGRAGAELNAATVIELLKEMPGNPFAPFTREVPAANW